MIFYFKVLIPVFVNSLFTYSYESELWIGTYVIVNFNHKQCLGVVWQCDSSIDIAVEKIKAIEQIINLLPPLQASYLKIIDQIALDHIEVPGLILKNAIPIICSNFKFFLKEKNIKLIESINKESPEITCDENFQINPFQIKSVNEIQQQFDIGKNIVLLEGETGSGKTEVYLELIKNILLTNSDAQILILLPEIALTNSLLSRIEKRLGKHVQQWHSCMSIKEKRSSYYNAISGKSNIFIGARSGIFLPFKSLALIIIDEEHDPSFKQEQNVIYHTIDIARIRLKHEHGCKLILSSATPSLETIYMIKKGLFGRSHLESRKTLQERMSIEVHDMKQEVSPLGGILSQKLIDKINHYNELGLQSMIFLNRRGYNSFIKCTQCYAHLSCPNCSVGLIYHKEIGKLYCHYCSYNEFVKHTSCQKCFTSGQFTFKGFGIERVFELLTEAFPGKKLLLISSDNIVGNKELRIAIDKIESGEVNIIVGTQILAKGHNFPHLGFLGIIDGGLNFSGIDLRSAEKTYQILHQIAGRVGRFETKGEVLIQTYEPDNILLSALQKHNRTQFYISELESRQKFEMPPFHHIIKISFISKFKDIAELIANKFIASAQYNHNVKILGPAPSPIFRMNGLFRYNVFFQSIKEFALSEYLASQMKLNKIHKQVKIKIDVNPISFI